jgi:hypothetical protein
MKLMDDAIAEASERDTAAGVESIEVFRRSEIIRQDFIKETSKKVMAHYDHRKKGQQPDPYGYLWAFDRNQVECKSLKILKELIDDTDSYNGVGYFDSEILKKVKHEVRQHQGRDIGFQNLSIGMSSQLEVRGSDLVGYCGSRLLKPARVWTNYPEHGLDAILDATRRFIPSGTKMKFCQAYMDLGIVVCGFEGLRSLYGKKKSCAYDFSIAFALVHNQDPDPDDGYPSGWCLDQQNCQVFVCDDCGQFSPMIFHVPQKGRQEHILCHRCGIHKWNEDFRPFMSLCDLTRLLNKNEPAQERTELHSDWKDNGLSPYYDENWVKDSSKNDLYGKDVPFISTIFEGWNYYDTNHQDETTITRPSLKEQHRFCVKDTENEEEERIIEIGPSWKIRWATFLKDINIMYLQEMRDLSLGPEDTTPPCDMCLAIEIQTIRSGEDLSVVSETNWLMGHPIPYLRCGHCKVLCCQRFFIRCREGGHVDACYVCTKKNESFD